MHRLLNSLKLLVLTACLCMFTGTSNAWYQAPPYLPYAQPYVGGPWSYLGNQGYAPGYYGYIQPRVYIHGRINRYGDYRMDMMIRGLSRKDIDQAWLWYDYMKYRRYYE